MSARVYLILDIVDNNVEEMAQVIKQIAGVIIVELLEGPPDILIQIEASDRYEAAKITNHLLSMLEDSIGDTQMFVVRDGSSDQISKTMPIF